MIPVHTQETLNSLSWNDIRNLPASLELTATETSRTRRDYEARILEAQPQKVEEPIAQLAPQSAEEDEPPNRGDNGRGRLRPNNNSFAALIAPVETNLVRSQSDLGFLYQQEKEAQIAIERTEIGSIGEEIGYKHLRNVEAKISKLESGVQVLTSPLPKIWDKASPDAAIGDYIRMPSHPIFTVADKEGMNDGRTRLLVCPSTGSGRSEEWYLDAPHPVERVWSLDEIEEAIAQLKGDIINPNQARVGETLPTGKSNQRY